MSVAATAFGLKTLLPLNVPGGEPLMYCPNKMLKQSKIQIDEKLFWCFEEELQVDCVKKAQENSKEIVENFETEDCANQTVECSVSLEQIDENLLCDSGVFQSKLPVVCDSAESFDDDEESTLLQCHYGQLSEALASFIPTTEDPLIENFVEGPPEKNFVYDVVSFFVDFFVPQSKKAVENDQATENYTFENTTEWLPDAVAMDL